MDQLAPARNFLTILSEQTKPIWVSDLAEPHAICEPMLFVVQLLRSYELIVSHDYKDLGMPQSSDLYRVSMRNPPHRDSMTQMFNRVTPTCIGSSLHTVRICRQEFMTSSCGSNNIIASKNKILSYPRRTLHVKGIKIRLARQRINSGNLYPC